MSGTYFTLNQKYNNLRTQDHGGGGGGGGGGGIYTAIGMVNITQYGASTALPDNTAFIQDAINAVAVGGTLYIPQGTFIILGSLTINTSFNIFGVGTIKAGGAMPYMLGLNASVDMFGGLTIDGDSLAVIGLRLLNTIVVRLNNVEIKRCTTGISSSALSSISLTLVDCLITNMTGTGISYPSPVITSPAIPPTLDVNNTIFRDCNKGISGILSSIIVVQGCIFDNVVFSISTGSFSATTTPFSYSITNNQFTRITGSAILINLLNVGAYNTATISNNIFSSRVSSYTPINTIGGTFSTFNYDSPVLGLFESITSSINTQFIQNTIEDMHIPETTSAIITNCNTLTASFNNIGFQSVITGTPGLFIKCLDTAPLQLPILFLDRNVFKTQAYMELVGFPALTPPIPGGFVVPTLTSSPTASFFDINTYSSGVDYVIDNTYETYAFTQAFANTISLIVNRSPTRIQFTNTSTAIGAVLYPTIIVNLLTNTDNPLTTFVACDGVSFPTSTQIRFGKSGTYDIVYNPTTDTLTATRLDDVGIATFNAVISTASINLTSPAFYNSIVNFTGTTASTITLPSPITNTRNNIYLGTSIQIFNNTSQQQTIQTTANILGVYGSQLLTIPLPENSWYKLVVDGTNWRINERSSNLTYQLPLSVNTDFSAYDYLRNATTRFAPTTALTATIPSPVSASGGSSGQTTMNIINNSDHVLTLLSPSSIDFRGKYGRGGGGTNDTIPMPPHSSVVLFSNGTFWFANERSYNPTYFITLSSVSTDASTFNFFSDATINISSTAVTNNILVIPPPTRGEIENATITFFNTSVYIIALSINAGTFAGKYGSGTTTYPVPANTSVRIVTDGTNWLVQERSGNPIFNFLPNGTTLTWTSSLEYLDSIIELVQPDSDLITKTPISGTASQSVYTLTVTASTGTISIGSIITLSGRRLIVRAQLTGTAGGTGTYLVNFPQSIASTSYTGFGGTGSVSSGTLSVNASQITNIPLFTPSGAVNPATTISVATATAVASNPFYVLSGTGSGTSCGSSASTNSTLNQTGIAYFSTSGSTINIPPATTSVNQMITFNNNSNNPVNLTTSAGTALFTGLFGQITGSGTFPGTFPNNYFLRPSESVVLMSDGTNWETQIGTSLSGARSFILPASVNTSTADKTINTLTNFAVSDLTYSSLYGVQLTSNVFANAYPFPISVSISVNLSWGNALVSLGTTTTIPQRILSIQPNNAGSGVGSTNSNINYLNFPATISSSSPNTFSPISGTINQNSSSVLTLKPGETIVVGAGKINGLSGTGPPSAFETILQGTTVYIQRIS